MPGKWVVESKFRFLHWWPIPGLSLHFLSLITPGMWVFLSGIYWVPEALSLNGVPPEAVKRDSCGCAMKSQSGISGIPFELFKEFFVAMGTLLNILQRERDKMERNFIMNENWIARSRSNNSNCQISQNFSLTKLFPFLPLQVVICH